MMASGISGVGQHFTTVDPSAPGLYFESKCQSPDCQFYDVLVYAPIGNDGSYDFIAETEKCFCTHCRRKVGPISGIVLAKCVWSYNGELKDGGSKESEIKVAHANYHLVEVEPYSWKWLNITVRPIADSQMPVKRRRASESDSDTREVKEEQKVSAIEPTNSVLKLQAAGFPSIEIIREDVQRKQEIIDILRAETKHKEKEKKKLEQKVQKLREEVERLKKAKSGGA